MDNSIKSPQHILKTFKKILGEASELYQKPASKVTGVEFTAVSSGRLGIHSMVKCGGFTKLRDYVAPTNNKASEETKLFFNRIMNAK